MPRKGVGALIREDALITLNTVYIMDIETQKSRYENGLIKTEHFIHIM